MQTYPFIAIGPPEDRFRGRLLRIASQVMRAQDGTETTFEYAERPPGVRILVTDGTLLLVTKEWRSESNSWDYRLPGGKVFDSLEDYLSAKDLGPNAIVRFATLAAQKELQEETSLLLPLDSFTLSHTSVCGATVMWDLYYYFARIGASHSTQLSSITTGEGEQIRPEWITRDEARALCIEGQVHEDRTAAVLLRYLLSSEEHPL